MTNLQCLLDAIVFSIGMNLRNCKNLRENKDEAAAAEAARY